MSLGEENAIGLAAGQNIREDRNETRMEAYLRWTLGQVALSPDIQFVLNPEGQDRKVAVFGLRMQIAYP
ncbi:MAG TPA: hypothetical protein EYP17_06480 [Candidatus Latescibacteria bacterium]|nr:hypothetical protein [Candidatus Latescibacterota bacterium]